MNGTSFVFKINPALSGGAFLLYSSYLGGTQSSITEFGNGIATDPAGLVYVVGVTASTAALNSETFRSLRPRRFNPHRAPAWRMELNSLQKSTQPKAEPRRCFTPPISEATARMLRDPESETQYSPLPRIRRVRRTSPAQQLRPTSRQPRTCERDSDCNDDESFTRHANSFHVAIFPVRFADQPARGGLVFLSVGAPQSQAQTLD
jgi:hypothetical protein